MAETQIIEPDLNFIREMGVYGGEDLKKCYQCATCSVVCPISPDNKPFPRKEMIAASWGLRDKVIKNADIWLCHNCGDCSTRCPRKAKPGDVLAAARASAIEEYSVPKAVARAVNDPKKLPILLAVPVVYFLILGLITGLLDLTPGGDRIVHAKFFSTWLVDIVMLSAVIWTVAIFAQGLKRFLNDIHANALKEGKTTKEKLEAVGFIAALIRVIPTILKHEKFNQCTENNERSIAHLLVLYSFIGLFVVTSIFFIAIYVFQNHGPYSQLNPVKWLANISGVALVVGSLLLIKQRRAKVDQVSTYRDWLLLGLVLGLGLSGLLSQITRLVSWAGFSYGIYFIHLMFVFCLFAYLPFLKLAHLVYRTVAMAYLEYSGRK